MWRVYDERRCVVYIAPFGDSAMRVCFGAADDSEARLAAETFSERLDAMRPAGYVECVTAYATVTVHVDASSPEIDKLLAIIQAESDRPAASIPGHFRVHRIPVLYGGLEDDLSFVASKTGHTPAEVAQKHASAEYVVELIGFLPGFAYLSGLPAELSVPRIATPRARVPAGSVGIMSAQCCVYPVRSPGGWRIIGRTPMRMFDPNADPPAILSAGDRVQFFPIDEDQFEQYQHDDRS
jgi:inhibitor of KinA